METEILWRYRPGIAAHLNGQGRRHKAHPPHRFVASESDADTMSSSWSPWCLLRLWHDTCCLATLSRSLSHPLTEHMDHCSLGSNYVIE